MSAFTHPYARAFIEMAPTGYDFGAFLESAGILTRSVQENRTLRAFLATPAVPLDAKRRAVEELAARAGIDPFGRRFFQVLLNNHRLLEAEQIVRSVRDAHDAKQGIVQGKLTVAAAIEDEEKKSIEEALANRVGGRVRLRVDVDPAILAGFVARVGSTVFDASATAAVRRFQQQAIARTGA
ncbi:MAG TPA: ATP synthase F1 subunit delta [Thermoanaerobaculia bacterium]